MLIISPVRFVKNADEEMKKATFASDPEEDWVHVVLARSIYVTGV